MTAADVDPDWDLISSYAGLLCLASVSICCGAFASLPPRPHDGERAPKKDLLLDDEGGGENEDGEEDVPDRMSSGDAWLLPIMGSAALFGLYVVVTYVGKEWINWLLGWYFSIAGVGSVWKCMASLAKFVAGRERWRTFDRNRIIFLQGPLEVVSVSFRTPTLALLPVAMLPSVLYLATGRSALWTDVLALSFSHNALSMLKLDSFRTGCIVLTGLFLYDVFWVFGTQVMVKVATSLDVPIKLLWPKSMTFGTERGFTMLGLGDVVIPGIFIALALRYDDARSEKGGRSFGRPYFYVTLTAYVVGLVTTMSVMHTSGRAQPALLYLSPACMLSLVATAVVRGEVGDVWRWSDDPELSREKTGEEAAVESRALPDDPNGKGTPQPNGEGDGGHVDGEGTEGGDEEERAEGEEGKKRRRRGKARKKA